MRQSHVDVDAEARY